MKTRFFLTRHTAYYHHSHFALYLCWCPVWALLDAPSGSLVLFHHHYFRRRHHHQWHNGSVRPLCTAGAEEPCGTAGLAICGLPAARPPLPPPPPLLLPPCHTELNKQKSILDEWHTMCPIISKQLFHRPSFMWYDTYCRTGDMILWNMPVLTYPLFAETNDDNNLFWVDLIKMMTIIQMSTHICRSAGPDPSGSPVDRNTHRFPECWRSSVHSPRSLWGTHHCLTEESTNNTQLRHGKASNSLNLMAD